MADWIIQIYRQIIDLLDFIIEPNHDICDKCGYKFKWNKTITMHPKCSLKFFTKSAKTQDRLKRKFEREPHICPICKTALSFQRVKGGIVCPRCRHPKLIKNPLRY